MNRSDFGQTKERLWLLAIVPNGVFKKADFL